MLSLAGMNDIDWTLRCTGFLNRCLVQLCVLVAPSPHAAGEQSVPGFACDLAVFVDRYIVVVDRAIICVDTEGHERSMPSLSRGRDAMYSARSRLVVVAGGRVIRGRLILIGPWCLWVELVVPVVCGLP
jgi:hypothetical protein